MARSMSDQDIILDYRMNVRFDPARVVIQARYVEVPSAND